MSNKTLIPPLPLAGASASSSASERGRNFRTDFPGIPDGWHYLDSAATAQKPQMVLDRIATHYAAGYATVHRGVYERSATMTLAFEAARQRVGEFLNANRSEEIVFTSGATDAINLVAQSWGAANLREGDRIMLSVI